jgi:hypothetical protein
MLDADGGVDSAVTTRVRCAWNKFRELAPFLTAKRVSLQVKGKVYESCVRSCMTYGSETWPLKVEHESRCGDNRHENDKMDVWCVTER